MADISLSLLVLKTHQLEELQRFYSALGIVFCEEQHGRGPVHYAGQIGDVVLELYPLKGDEPADGSTRLGFAVPDLDSTLQLLTETDLHEPTTARQTEWGYRAIIRDPDGRAVELCEK